jgi:signal transduction histidine kinase
MGEPLRVLIVEDSEADCALLVRVLENGGYDVTHRRVQTLETTRAALSECAWDVIVSDYSMPQFSAMAALAALKESQHDIPFIVVSGTVGEETAVQTLKEGAHDFMLKDRLLRLLPAIERERREVEVRRERRQAIEDMKLAIRARDEFLSMASHEFKTPLTSLVLLMTRTLSLLRAPVGTDNQLDKVEQQVEKATRQISRLTRLVNNLLDVAQIMSGRLRLAPEPIDLRNVVETVTRDLQDGIESCRSVFTIRGDAPVTGHWDRLALETVVTNLLTNAIKFGEGRPIDVTVGAEREKALLTIVDHGLGIAPDDQARIFQRFERAVPMQHYGGLGIGLWIVRQIVEAHDGVIRVESTRGQGSSFTVELPLTGPTSIQLTDSERAIALGGRRPDPIGDRH